MRAPLILSAILISSQASADIHVRFDEGAPKDRFTITRAGSCDMGAAKVVVDLSGSPHGLIFDVTETGSGVEVFQPFRLVAGKSNLSELPTVRDGDQSITLPITSLARDQSVAFTIDVDDTAGGREITVSDTEIAGAKVAVSTQAGTFIGTFDDSANAVVSLDDCTS